MKTFTFTNDFHNTSATVRVDNSKVETFVKDTGYGEQKFFRVTLSARQAKIVEKKLCGMDDCECGRHGPRFEPVDFKRGGDVCIVLSAE